MNTDQYFVAPEPKLVTLTNTLHELTSALTAKTAGKTFIISEPGARKALEHAIGGVAREISNATTSVTVEEIRERRAIRSRNID